jgi:hypothetical protein
MHFSHEVPIKRYEDRVLILTTCIFAIILNFFVQLGANRPMISNKIFKFALLMFNIKSECSILEIGLQLFILASFAVHKSGILSSEMYAAAFMQNYRETIQSNEQMREQVMHRLCNSICAVQLLNEDKDFPLGHKNRHRKQTYA